MWCVWVLSYWDSISPQNKVPISCLSLVGREGLFVGLESWMQKLQRLTTYFSGVTPMPPSCLPWSWVPSRTKARFCWANWFCYNSPTPNKEVIMFFILSPFNFIFIKFWNISGIKIIRASSLNSPPNKKKHNITNRDRSLWSCSLISYTCALGKMCGNHSFIHLLSLWVYTIFILYWHVTFGEREKTNICPQYY